VGRHFLVAAYDLDGRSREAADMRAPARDSRSSGGAPRRRDYDRRKKRRTVTRKAGRPLWRRPLLLGLAVLLLGLGAGGGWLAWRQGWLVAVQDRIDSVSRSVVAAITPFKLTDVTVEGRDYVSREAILAALDVKAGDSLLGIDLQAARKRLEAIDWVASATVERRLPDTLYVTLKERRAVAIWQNGNEYTLIDQNGRTVRASRMPPGAESLLLLGGPGAPEHVGDLLLLLAYEPGIAKRLRAAVWVGQRRWNLILKNDVQVWLPEEDAVAALQRVAKLDSDYKLLSREFGVVDLRLPDKLYLRKRGSAEDTPAAATAKPVQSKV
jgi:cell division protein FtsQ